MSYRRRLLVWIPLALGLAVGAILIAWAGGHARSDRRLEIELRTSAGSFAQLYWDIGSGFSEARSSRLPLGRDPERFQHLRFVLPRESIRGLRFDPIDNPGEVVVRRLQVRDSSGGVIATLNPASLLPMHEIVSMKLERDELRIVTSGSDPFLHVTPACLEPPAPWYSLASVTPMSLTLVSVAVAALLAASFVTIGRNVFGRRRAGADAPRQSRGLISLWFVALFLVTFSAKLLLIHRYPAPVPFVDQWIAEAGVLYVPFEEGCLAWRQMLTLHNEHRIFFTRLLALALLSVNGQWDPQLQQVTNAALHASTAFVVAAVFWLASGRRRLDVIVLLCGVTFAMPFSWENTLAGFQSAFYFLLLFSVLAFWLTSVHPTGSKAWLLGWVCAFCAVFTSAGGLLTAVGLMVTPVVRLATDRGRWREAAINLGAAGVALAVGLAAKAPPLGYHADFKAGTVGAFATAFGRNLAWPWIDAPLLTVMMWLPIGVLASAALWRRDRPTRSDETIYAVGIWVVLQAAALAYSRGVGGQSPASRYMDVLSFGFVANAMALFAVLDRVGRTSVRRAALIATTVWLLVAVVGIDQLTRESLTPGAVTRRAWMEAYVRNVRSFLMTDDLKALTSKPFPFEVPFFDPSLLANGWLRHPYVRRILPAAIREPLPVRARATTEDVFVTDGVYPTTPRDALRHSRGSYSKQGNPAHGRFASDPISPCQIAGQLKFEVAGYLGEAGLSLAVNEVESDREQQIMPQELARERWIGARVRCPEGPFEVVAVDATPLFWFAFREPVEIGWASAAAETLIGRSRWLFLVAMAVAVLAARWT